MEPFSLGGRGPQGSGKGVLIAFEGIDGCGKSTQVGLLAAHLERRGISTLVTREPGGTRVGQEIRRVLLNPDLPTVPLAELLLYLADRAQHVEEVILPALEEGMVVLTDRFSLSTLAYQCYGRELPRTLFFEVSRWILKGLKPDLTLVLDIPAEDVQKRIGTGKDRMEREDGGFFSRVREGFLCEANKDDSIVVVDASQPVEEVHRMVVELVESIL